MSVMWAAAIVLAMTQGWLTPSKAVGILAGLGLVVGIVHLVLRLASIR